MSIVTTISEKCKRCYTCVRECPAKAIKVENGQAAVIEERCITCGNCVKVCAQQAKLIEDSTKEAGRLLAGKEPVFACLAPSFPAAFYPEDPGKLIAAIRKLGFSEVWEVAFGAELISREYTKLLKKSLRSRSNVICSPCPAITSYVEKYMPSLHDIIAPIVSPMIAVARAIKQRHGSGVGIVFIGPCIAKKNEIRDPNVAGTVDTVLTFKELLGMIDIAGITLDELKESDFDGPRSYFGRSFALSGGLLKTAGLSTDILENNILITEGKERVLASLEELAQGKTKAILFDVLFCEGCINGPKMLNNLSVFARKEIVADFANKQNRYTKQRDFVEALREFEDLSLSRSFTREAVSLPQPTEQEIAQALASMKKFTPEDQLNCGACGYLTCREKAIAVGQGLAEAEMCLPYLVEELEATCDRLQKSHLELASAQDRLVQTERLASMGQISAGVAHEINNPLGTVLIYSHMLLKECKDGDARKEDLRMIVNEATRCKSIMHGLLDFARQSRTSKTKTMLSALIGEVVSIMSVPAEANGVCITCDIQDDLPAMIIDANQIKQLVINIVQNGIDSIENRGEVSINVCLNQEGDGVEIRVTDNGSGISEDNLAELFAPFFTTKEVGKGTGLGLSIAHGIAKMHSGDISVESEPGRGTTFYIRIPLAQEVDNNKDYIISSSENGKGEKL